MKLRYAGIIATLCGLLIACDDGTNFAPVTEVSTIDPIPHSGTHRVASGETLYEVAWRYGLDYRNIAAINHIDPPYTVRVGQVVYLRQQKTNVVKNVGWVSAQRVTQQAKPSTGDVKKNVGLRSANPTYVSTKEPDFIIGTWHWPAKGKVIRTFSAMNRGINIAGAEGESVYTSAPGKVVYCGDGLRGYGNLIIIKHNSTYLSAYAHNKVVFVHEGDWVKQGQIIAEIGKSGATKPMLHFEIRRAGKPVDPMPLLKS